MYNLKKFNGSYKGLIGECMFKLTRKWVCLPKFWSKNKYFETFGKYFDSNQNMFLSKNWYSIDAVEILFYGGKKTITLYEVKTKNKYRKTLFFKPKMTLSVHNLYQEAKTLGFTVKMAVVLFKEGWDYDIDMIDFDASNYCIDKPKEYDKI